MSDDGADPWFVSAFRADYLRVYPHRDLESGRAEVAHLIRRGLGTPVLDLCCGFGRHTLALREAGIEAVGLDLSHELLLEASGLPGGGSLRGLLARGDARALPFARGSLGAVTMLFSSFGYFDDVANGGVLAEVARVLKPGGRAVFDLMNPARIRATLVPESSRHVDGYLLRERRRLLDEGRRVVKEVRLEPTDGEPRSWTEDVRMYEPSELDQLCATAGLTVEARDGDFADVEFDIESPRQIVWTRRDSSPAT